MKPFETEFGWSRTAIVGCMSAFTGGLIIGTPLAGRLVDRIGVRIVAMSSMLVLAACMLGMALLGGAIWQLYALYFLMGSLGAGSGGVAYTRAIGGFFVEGRGLALGVALTATGVASFVSPNLIVFLTDWGGWRSACVGISALILLVGLPTIFFGLPEPARTASVVSRKAGDPPKPLDGKSRAEALRDYRFWLLVTTVVALGLFNVSLTVHAVPMLIDKGLTPTHAAQTASIIGIAMIVCRLVDGPLLDRFPAGYVGAVVSLLGACGISLFVALGPSAAIFMVVSVGLLIGAEVNIMSFMVLQYFGLRNYGAIYGIVLGIYSASSMLTPLVSGGLLALGGYDALYAGAATTFMISTAAFLILGFVGWKRT